LSTTEITNIHNAGLKIWSIYEEGLPTHASYFTTAQGKSDASTAISQAEGLGVPKGTPIFFAVDYAPDVSTDQTAILDYFNGVASEMASASPRWSCDKRTLSRRESCGVPVRIHRSRTAFWIASRASGSECAANSSATASGIQITEN